MARRGRSGAYFSTCHKDLVATSFALAALGLLLHTRNMSDDLRRRALAGDEDALEELLRRRAGDERARADEERARADEERARADEEHARADEERARADEEHARADELQVRVTRLWYVFRLNNRCSTTYLRLRPFYMTV